MQLGQRRNDSLRSLKKREDLHGFKLAIITSYYYFYRALSAFYARRTDRVLFHRRIPSPQPIFSFLVESSEKNYAGHSDLFGNG